MGAPILKTLQKEINVPLDVSYILGLSGPSQGTYRTDRSLGTVIIKDVFGNSVAEFSSIEITVSELTDSKGNKSYNVAADMDVKSLGYSVSLTVSTSPVLSIEFRDVNRGIIYQAGLPISVSCGAPYSKYHYVASRSIPDLNWLQGWASTSLRVDGGWSPC